MIRCPLCECQNIDQSSSIFIKNIKKYVDYHRCSECELLFMDPKFLLTSKGEKERYKSHNNDPEDSGYINYLSELWNLSSRYLGKEIIEVLDFGCGPTAGLEINFSDSKNKIDSYDPYFFKQKPSKKYDLVYASECFEHFNKPIESIKEVDEYLKPGGVLAIRTELLTPDIDFEKWYYKNDLTHVSFYSENTINYIANQFNYELKYLDKNKVIYQK